MMQIGFQQETFDDCDDWCSMASGWDLRFQQLEKGALSARITRAITPELILQEVSASRLLHQSGCGPRGLITFGLPTNTDLHRCFGRELDGSSIINFGRRGGYDSVS